MGERYKAKGLVAHRQGRTSDRGRTSGCSRGSGHLEGVGLPTFLLWTGGVGRPVGIGRPSAGDLSDVRRRPVAVDRRTSGGSSIVRPLGTLHLRLLPSSLPRFPHGWCSCSLALALLLVIREAPKIPVTPQDRSFRCLPGFPGFVV